VVEQDAVVRRLPQVLERRGGANRFVGTGADARLLQAPAHREAVELVVVDDEQSHGSSTSDQYLSSATITSQKFSKVTGFTRYPATFRLNASIRSRSSLEVISTTTDVAASPGSWRSSRRNSIPFIRGMLRSRSTIRRPRGTASLRSISSASSPSPATKRGLVMWCFAKARR